MTLHWINTEDVKPESRGEFQRVLPFSTAKVNDWGALWQPKIAHEVIEHLRPAWIQTRIQRGLKFLFHAWIGVIKLVEGKMAL